MRVELADGRGEAGGDTGILKDWDGGVMALWEDEKCAGATLTKWRRETIDLWLSINLGTIKLGTMNASPGHRDLVRYSISWILVISR